MILKGIPASKGIVKGPAKKYAKNKLLKGDILIAKTTTPSMSIDMIKAIAVITEYGGMLSHAAIFCRELGIPCIVGVKDILNKINDGDILTINGEEGIIEKEN